MNELYPPGREVSSKEKKASLSKQFQSQLNTLMRRLNKTQPHYIRCVKPNNDKRAKYFVPRNCYEQLTYSGVFEAVAIRKQGYVVGASTKLWCRMLGITFCEKLLSMTFLVLLIGIDFHSAFHMASLLHGMESFAKERPQGSGPKRSAAPSSRNSSSVPTM